MYIVVKYKIHLYSLRNRPEKLAILPVSKARTNKFYIYRQCTYIVYVLISTNTDIIDIAFLAPFTQIDYEIYIDIPQIPNPYGCNHHYIFGL